MTRYLIAALLGMAGLMWGYQFAPPIVHINLSECESVDLRSGDYTIEVNLSSRDAHIRIRRPTVMDCKLWPKEPAR